MSPDMVAVCETTGEQTLCPRCGGSGLARRRPANDRRRRRRNAERDVLIVSAVETGQTFTEIGQSLGISRQRVHKIAACAGVQSLHAEARHSLTIVRILREQPVCGKTEIACAIGCHTRTVQRVLERLGLWPAAQRLFRLRRQIRARRRTEAAKTRVVQAIRDYYARTGSTSCREFRGPNSPGRLWFTDVNRLFGSWSTAVQLAGCPLMRRPNGAVVHGTRTMYNRGCRCDDCRAVRSADYRHRRIPAAQVGP